MTKLFPFISLSLILLVGCTNTPYNAELVMHEKNYQIDQGKLNGHLKLLSSDKLEGRKVNTNGSIAAQNYIIEQLTSFGVSPFGSPSFLHPFSFDDIQASNIVGLIPSNTPSTKYIILTAHYDHLGKKGAQIFNGADDNASGVAALLSISELISQSPLKHNLIVLFTDAEESNLKGAIHFVNSHEEIREDLLVNINVDMIAGSTNTKTLHYITYKLPKVFTESAQDLFRRRHLHQSIKIRRGFDRAVGSSSTNSRRNWRLASDHGAFYRKKIPFIYYGVGEHKTYHTVDDDFEHINQPFFWHSTNIIYNQIRFIDENID